MAFAFIKKVPTINFTSYRFYGYGFSAIALIFSLVFLLINNGLKFGVDFAGGVMVQVNFQEQVSDEAVKNALDDLSIPGLAVQQLGLENTEYLIRFTLPSDGEDYRVEIIDTINENLPNNEASIQRVEMVGPKVGEDLKNSALEALFYAVLLIVVYISGRFERRWFLTAAIAIGLALLAYVLDMFGLGRIWQVSLSMVLTLAVCLVLRLNFAFGAIAALLHDVFITVGILTFLGKEIDLNIIAALLTIIGYSLNDTIVSYDRMRENLMAQNPESPDTMGNIINLSINQTLSRTILTSGTTLVAVLSLYLFGGGIINDFALTMLLGVLIGTFSSIFVANPLLMALGDSNLYVMRFQKNETEQHEKPGEHGVV